MSARRPRLTPPATRAGYLRANLAGLRKDLATGTMTPEERRDLEDTVRVGERELGDLEHMLLRGAAP